MFGRSLKKQRPRHPVSAGIINSGLDAANRASTPRVGSGMECIQVAGTPYYRALRYPGIAYALTGGSGIGACTSDGLTPPTFTSGVADCTLYFKSDGKWHTTQQTIKVYNSYTTTGGVGANKFIPIAQAEDGTWETLGEPCP